MTDERNRPFPEEPLTVEDVAEALGIGVRSLRDGFRRYLDTTPMSYLRETRLRRVRATSSWPTPRVPASP